MRKLTEDEVKELRKYKYEPDGDIKYWDKMAEFYAGDEETLKRIAFERSYVQSIHAIPLGYTSYVKSMNQYLATVDAFNRDAGYTSEPKNEIPDNLREKIAARFGIDIDADGDGISSLEHYGRKN